MLRLFVAGVRAYRRKLVLAGLATLIGTAFVAGALVVSDTLQANVERTVVGGAARVDVVAVTNNQLQPLTPAAVERIRALPGVRSAQGLIRGDITVLGPGGRPASEQPVGFSTTVRTDLTAGRMPTEGEVLLAEQTSRALGQGIGGRVTVLDPATGGPRSFTVSGLAGVAGQGELALRGGIGFTPAAAAVVTGQRGVTEIYVQGDDPDVLRGRVAAVLGDGPYAAFGGRAYAEAQAAGSGLDPAVLGTGLLMFALVALLVAVFVIQNTFSILLGRRTRELALARCLGATRGQVFASILAEAGAVGVVASALGAAAGVGAAYGSLPLLRMSGADVPASVVTVTPVTVLVALATGILATIAAAAVPARAATRVPPVAALRTVPESGPTGVAGRRIIAGSTFCGMGVLSAAAGLISSGRLYPLVLVAAGGALFFLGVVALGPLFVGPVAHVVGAPIARLCGAPGRLAIANAVRAPRRAATTVLALVIGIALTVGVSVITRSLESSIGAGVAQALPADYVITPPGSGPDSVIPRSVADDLVDQPGVASLTQVREAAIQAGGRPAQLSTTVGTITPTVINGTPRPLQAGQLALRPERAAELGVAVGDTLNIAVRGRTVTLDVVAVVTGNAVPRMIVADTFFDSLFPGRGDAAVLVGFAPDADPQQSRAVIEQATAQAPTVRIVSAYDAKQRVTDNLGQAAALITALLAFAILISLIGVTNTLTLSVLERTRESAMLRALGLGPRGLRTMFTAEAVILGLIGGLVGTLLGTGFGLAAAQVINDRVAPVIPWDLLIIVLLGAGAATVAASVLPARQAARIPVIAALAHD